MKKHFLNGLIIFLVLLISSQYLMQFFNLEFGTIDYFQKHGIFFLICVAIFPRLTLLFSNVVSGGLLWWLSFFFYPRILVATLATLAYFKTNPALVVVSWLIAIPAEAAEKWAIRSPRFQIRTFNGRGNSDFFKQFGGRGNDSAESSNTHHESGEKPDIIDAEYRVIKEDDE